MNSTKILTLSGFDQTTLLYSSATSLVYRGYWAIYQQPVILKLLREQAHTAKQFACFQREYELIQSLNLPGVVKVYGLDSHQPYPIMILEDFGGESLTQLRLAGKLPLVDFLQLAIAVTKILGQVHSFNIIHKDINPSNIVFNPTTKTVKLIDFGIASVLSQENLAFIPANTLEGTLPYLSPEQTGRMNRTIDYRSDFYALGVTFYELLTGRLPFESSDPLELVHSHIAKQPTPPSQLFPSHIPETLSYLILKLMAKNAEDRYQSAYGIKMDLERCLEQIQTQGQILDFPLGCYDLSDKLQIPQKLYERNQPLQKLLNAFETISKGQQKIILISGYPGVGKSSLVQEINKSITAQRGIFISGKFEQYKQNIPYSAIAHALNEFCLQILTENQETVQKWKHKILEAVGKNGQILIDVIPNLERIIGQQPSESFVTFPGSQNYFFWVFIKFIQAISQREHPLVIFLDDWQWADWASLHLIKTLNRDQMMHYLLIIGTYREQELHRNSYLKLVLQEIKETQGKNFEIVLENLSLKEVNHLIAEGLSCVPQLSQSLANLVYQKTQGNPFFTREFLKSLYTEGLLRFEYPNQLSWTQGTKKGKWVWDVEQIKAKNISDNVVELVINQIGNLTPETQRVIQWAACLGSEFDLSTLAILLDQTLFTVFEQLFPALQLGLVISIGSSYPLNLTSSTAVRGNFSFKFQHDRVQQAAYSLIAETEKPSLHWKIGWILLDQNSPKLLDDQVFTIINHLNLGDQQISDNKERFKLIELNQMAGEKAQESTAYQLAVNYFKISLKLLPENAWVTHYETTLNLYNALIKGIFELEKWAEIEQLVDEILINTKSLIDKIFAYKVKIQAYIAQSKMQEAIQTALQVLSLLGIEIPAKPCINDIQTSLAETQLKLQGKSLKHLINLPVISDPIQLAGIRILFSIIPASYRGCPQFFPLIISKLVSLSIEFGNTDLSPCIYTSYGLVLAGIGGEIEMGFYWGNIGLKLLKKFNHSLNKAKSHYIFTAFINSWKTPLKNIIISLQKNYEMSLTNGDLSFAGYVALTYCEYAYFAGIPLLKVEQNFLKAIQSSKQLNQYHVESYLEIYHLIILKLLTPQSEPEFSIKIQRDQKLRKINRFFKSISDAYGLFHFYLNQLIFYYLFRKTKAATRTATLARQYLEVARGHISLAVFYFYESLALLRLNLESNQSLSSQIFSQVESNQSQLQVWAKSAAINFQHKYDLVEAEKSRKVGQYWQAAQYYEKAIQGAIQSGYHQEAALAYELAAEFYLVQEMKELAKIYSQKAYDYYTQWKAWAKANDLEHRYSEFVSSPIDVIAVEPLTATHPTNSSSSLDIASIFKASQALSREISIEQLLTKLIKIVVENAGAERGILILESNGQWLIQASVTSDPEEVNVLQAIPIEQIYPPSATSEVCPSIVNYVIHTQESLVIHNAIEAHKFTTDFYIIHHKPKSILCVPLLNQGKLIGILYLENNLMAGAFTSERLEVLNLLSSQAAISIENALLYRTLEEKVTERTKALQQEIIERKRIEKALRESQERFELAMRGANDGLWDWNVTTGEAYYSPRYQEMIGYFDLEFQPKIDEFIQRIHPEDKDFVLNQIYKYIHREITTYEISFRMLHKKGHYIWILSRGIGLSEQSDQMTRIVGINIDMTEQKKVEEALKQAKEDAEAASRAKSEFLANMSHELRTPLNGILGYTQILKRSQSLHQQDQTGIQVIHQCGTHLLTLINDILDLSKIEAGKLELYPTLINLEVLLQGVVEICQIKAQQKGLAFIYKPLSPFPLNVEVDGIRLRQILINLLGNAVKFTDGGGVMFSVNVIDNHFQNSQVQSSAFPNLKTIQFKVEDTGIGMTPAQLEKIFLPFEQVGDHSYRTEGTGLGLTITQRLIQHMGSQLNVESCFGKSSCFWFELDLPISLEWEAITEPNKFYAIVGFTGNKRRILVVDDKPENRSVVVDLLQPLGFEMIEASQGQEGLEKLLSLNIDLVIADLVMPIMDGFEMTRRIRALPALKNIPVIATSASVYQWDREQSQDAGCNDFISKPLQAEELLNKIKTWLQLEWEYYHSNNQVISPPEERDIDLIFPPDEILLNLVNLAKRGRVLEVGEEATKLKQQDPRFHAFASRIQSLAQDFKLTQIKELLAQCKIN